MDDQGGKIYVAGPLFTSAERAYLEQIERICQRAGFTTYLPHRDAGLSSDATSREYVFEKDKTILDEVVLIVAVLNGTDVDSGTAWEMGYAYARGIAILGIADDKRILQSPQSLNPMLYYSMDFCASLAELEDKLLSYRTKSD